MAKKVFFIIFAALLLVSCNKNNNKFTGIPFLSGNNGCWGILDENGKVLVDGMFMHQPSMECDGYFWAPDNDDSTSITLWKVGKQPIEVAQNLKQAGFMSDGLIPVVKSGQRIKVIDGDGGIVFEVEPYFGQEIVRMASYFNDGLAAVQTAAGLWGFVDKTGKMVIEPQYSDVTCFVDGVAFAVKGKGSTGQLQLIKESGQVIKSFDAETTIGGIFHSAKSAIVYRGHYAYKVDYSGEEVALPTYVSLVTGVVGNNYSYKSTAGGYGVNTLDGYIVIKPKYQAVTLLNDGNILVQKTDGEFKIVNTYGEILSDVGSREIALGFGNFIFLKNAGTTKMIDSEGYILEDLNCAQIGGVANLLIESDYGKEVKPAYEK